MPLTAGDSLQGRYTIQALLGQGGMGAVYGARDTRLDVPVALKEMVPQPGLGSDRLTDLRRQFQQEAQVLARLSHPNLVRVTDFFQEGGNGYLVMNYVQGESMAARIQREGALPEADVLLWADQLLRALAYCHEKGVIHRDVKPHNVIIRRDGQAVLVDFGLVKLWDPRDPRTRTAIRAMGTPEYAPPEQYDAQLGHTDPRSDIYGLGATLYHALSGKAPPTATQRVVDPGVLVPLSALNAQVTPGLETVIMRALALQPAQRYGSAREMWTALKEAVTLPAPEAAPASAPEKTAAASATEVAGAPRSRPGRRVPAAAWMAGGLVGLALLAAGVGIALGIGRGPGLTQRATQTPMSASLAMDGSLTPSSSDRSSETTAAPAESPTSSSPSALSVTDPPDTAAPMATDTARPTNTPVPSPTETPIPSMTPTQPPSATPTEPPTLTPTATPTPDTPGPTAVRVTGRVMWSTSPVAGARIELKEQGNYYDQPVLAQTTTDAGGWFSLEDPPVGSYQIYAVSPSEEYWRWTGRSIQIASGAAVDAGMFRLKKKLQLLEPVNDAVLDTTTPTLRWQAFPDAVRYHVNLFVDATGEAVLRRDTTETSLTVSPPLAAGVRYQWSVDAYDASGTTIAYFSPWRFTVQGP